MTARADRSFGSWSRFARTPWATAVVWVSALGVYGLWMGRPAWSVDEGATVVVVRSGWSVAWRVAFNDAALGAYYLAMKPWAAVSTSHVWMRLPSVLAAATAVAVLFVLVRRIAGNRAAAVTALVLLISPRMTEYAAYARPYAFAVLGCVLVVAFWWSYVEHGRIASACGLVAALVLTSLAHPYALLIAVALVAAATLAPLRSRPSDLRRTLVPLTASLVVLAPWLWHVAAGAKGSPDPLPVTVRNFALSLLVLPGLHDPAHLWLAFGAIVLLIAAAGYWVGYSSGGALRTLSVLTFTWLLTVPSALAVWQLVTADPGMVVRYWFVSVPPIAVGVGLALGRLSCHHPALTLACIALIAVLSAPGQWAARSFDADRGAAYVSLHSVMELPSLASAPVIIRPEEYRGMIANDPSVGGRFPLLGGAGGPPDPIHPIPAVIPSEPFDTMVREHPTIIVYNENLARLDDESGLTPPLVPPLHPHFPGYHATVVTCDFYGGALRVLTQQPYSFSAEQRMELARSIESVAPAHIVCFE